MQKMSKEVALRWVQNGFKPVKRTFEEWLQHIDNWVVCWSNEHAAYMATDGINTVTDTNPIDLCARCWMWERGCDIRINN